MANVFRSAGFKKGDTVALYMGSSPQYVCTWLGLSKLGVITAFVNYNLRSQPLIHSIRVADCLAAIFTADLADGESVVPSPSPAQPSPAQPA